MRSACSAQIGRWQGWWVACGQRAESHIPTGGWSAVGVPASLRQSAREGSVNRRRFAGPMCRVLARLVSRFSTSRSLLWVLGADAAAGSSFSSTLAKNSVRLRAPGRRAGCPAGSCDTRPGPAGAPLRRQGRSSRPAVPAVAAFVPEARPERGVRRFRADLDPATAGAREAVPVEEPGVEVGIAVTEGQPGQRPSCRYCWRHGRRTARPPAASWSVCGGWVLPPFPPCRRSRPAAVLALPLIRGAGCGGGWGCRPCRGAVVLMCGLCRWLWVWWPVARSVSWRVSAGWAGGRCGCGAMSRWLLRATGGSRCCVRRCPCGWRGP